MRLSNKRTFILFDWRGNTLTHLMFSYGDHTKTTASEAWARGVETRCILGFKDAGKITVADDGKTIDLPNAVFRFHSNGFRFGAGDFLCIAGPEFEKTKEELAQ